MMAITLARVAATILAGTVVGAATVAAWPGGDDSRLDVTAVFSDASPLVPGNGVKVSGVTVGQIEAVKLVNGVAHVEMALDQSVLPLHEDARAIITSKDVLGERYVNLERGSPDSPTVAEPITIANSHTDRVVDIGSVLNMVDNPTGTALAAMLTTLGQGVAGQGPEIAATIKAIEPAYQPVDELARILSDQNGVLTSLIDATEPVSDAMAKNKGRELDRMVASTEHTLSTTAANREAVAGALQRLPETLRKAERTLARVAGVAKSGSATLSELRPITEDLTKISGELRRFADAAKPALNSLNPVLARAQELIDEAAPLVQTLRPAGADLHSVATSGRQISEQGLSLRLKHLMGFIRGWALSTNGYDALGHYFRASFPVTPKILGGPTALGGVPGAPEDPVPNLPLPEPNRLPLPGQCQGVDTHPCQPDHPAEEEFLKPDRTVTGLTRKQENAMLGQLLGGL